MSYLGKYFLVGLSDQEISELSKLQGLFEVFSAKNIFCNLDRLTRLADYAKHKSNSTLFFRTCYLFFV